MASLVNPVAPPEVVIALKRVDHLLRLRWCHRKCLWAIERKCPDRFPGWVKERPSPYKSARGLDIWDGWKDGYMFVMFVHPELLGRPVMWEMLHACDAHAQNGMKEISRHLDEEQAKKEAAADKGIDDWAQAASRESHDRIQWLMGNRFATPMSEHAPPPPDVETEQHDGFVVRVKKPSYGLA